MSGSLDAVTSIKVKLGILVAASVVVAAVLGASGTAAGVPALLTLPVAVAIALGVTQLLAAGMVAPLRQMTDVAQQMARGDYSGRVRTTSTDEVGRLASAFNHMAADLARVEEERRDLIATVSHELRTPLAAMTAVLENLADGVVPADDAHLGAALAQAERLRGLVSDLLDLSRLEAGVVPLHTLTVSVAELVAESVAEVRAAGPRADYRVEVPEDLLVDVDPGRLRQLLTNVLENAARHAPDGRPVRVLADTGDGRWWLEVRDEGSGVDGSDRERVFERFGTDPAGGGTGLGLAVARWVAQLHGGTLRFVDPEPGASGARLRLELPSRPPVPDASSSSKDSVAPTAPQPSRGETVPAPDRAEPASAAGQGLVSALFGRSWPEDPGSSHLGVVAASAAVGVLAGALMTFTGPGLSWSVVLVAAGAAALAWARRRREPFTLLCAGLSLLLVLPMLLLDNEGIPMLSVLVAAGTFLVGVTGASTLAGFVLTGLAWPLAALRGLPWFGRSLRLVGSPGRASAVVRTAAWSVLGLVVFGSLFASADVLFATWVDALVPNLTFNDLVVRAFVGVAVFGLTLAAAYLALNPPLVEPDGKPATPLRNRFEWLVPVLLVDLVFVLFLVAQAAAVFGGHEYVERTTGLTYAEHVHRGFGQLTVATALTLLVVWAAARRAGRTRSDRVWLRVSLGALCGLTLVVVASALHRMDVYQEAYGFTTLRLTVDVFEAWLGLVVLAVAVLGGLGRGRWLPRVALVTGVLAVLGLAAVNPDAWVAERNVDRFEATGALDLHYLRELSADAAPVVAARLPEDVASCALMHLAADVEGEEGIGAWNLGRERAQRVVDRLGLRQPDADDLRRCEGVQRRLDVPVAPLQ